MHRFMVLLLALTAAAGCLSDSGSDDPDTSDDSTPAPSDGMEPGQSGYQGFDETPEDCQKIVPPGPLDLSGQTVLGGTTTRVLDLAIATDQSFRDLYGDEWEATALKVADAADAIYTEQLDLNVNVTAVIPIPVEDLHVPENTSGNVEAEQSQKIIDDTRAYFETHHDDLHRDIVYTLVGNSTAGVIAGQVDCIGGAKFKDVSYGWGEGQNLEGALIDLGPAQLGQATGLKVILHEMAHLLGAHHHYQTCGPHAAQSGTSDAFGVCSIMTNAVDFASFHFSEINKIAIRGYAEEVDL